MLHFHKAGSDQMNRLKVQLQDNLPNHKLKENASTRWGSTAGMVKRALEQKEAIRIVLSGDRSTSHLAITCANLSSGSILIND